MEGSDSTSSILDLLLSSVTFNIVCSSIFIYLGSLIVYRVYFSPISQFPGPWLAKVTFWYEFYYDVIQPGQYTFKIGRMHEKYGPIVRINPEELHIADPNYYDELYSGPGKKRDKYSWFCGQFGIPDATFATVDHDLHRIRRSALNPFFSKAKVRNLEPMIENVVYKLLNRFEEHQKTQQPMNMSFAFAALTNDIAMQYAFARNENRVEADGFDPSFYHASITASTMGHFMKQFPWILSIMQMLPDSVAVTLDPDMGTYVKLQRDIFKQVDDVRSSPKNTTADGQTTIFHEILNSDLPEETKSWSRLWQDGQVTVIAGTITTATALSTALYYLIEQPETMRKLKEELAKTTTDPFQLPSWTVLEQMPYLTACVQESLRMSNGASTRLQRVSPKEPLVFKDGQKDWVIPPGTPVGMTGTLIHFDPKNFESPHSFRPERWLENPRLTKYLVAFSRGTRQCIGINLAYAELYITLAGVFREYGSAGVRMTGDKGYLELYETSLKDVEIFGDKVIPIAVPGSVGIRIRVKSYDG